MYLDKKVSLVLPAFNEEENIAQAIDEFKKLKIVDEIIVVDNNSKDNTASIALKKSALVIPEKKQGYGFALRKGMSKATGDYICLSEPDGTFRASDLITLLKPLDTYDVVIGTRTNSKYISKKANMKGALLLGNILLAKCITFLYRPGLQLSDCGCTYRAMRKSAIKKILPKLTIGQSHFLAEFLVLLLKMNFSILEKPIHYQQRVGKSKITGSLKRSVLVGLQMSKVILNYRF